MAKRLKKANDENDDLKNENSKLKNEIKDLNKKNEDLEKILEDNKKLIEDHCSKVWKDSLYFCDGPISNFYINGSTRSKAVVWTKGLVMGGPSWAI